VTIVAALVIALACVTASLRRLAFAVAPTPLDPARIARALRGDAGRARFAAVDESVRAAPEGQWERALFEAARRPAAERAAYVNEQLTEVDYLAQRWERVPRVCASVASSSGFLLAAVALRVGLGDPAAFDPETRSAILGGALVDAIDTATIGIAGAAFCIAAQMAAKKAARARVDAVDELVERLEALTRTR
jgi:hypothetical protein